MQGSQRPMGLYTYDVSLELVAKPDADSSPATPVMETPAPRDAGSRRPSANAAPPKTQVLAAQILRGELLGLHEFVLSS